MINERYWQLGDIVSRDGSDEHEILEISETRDVILVRCIKAPSDGWCEVGEEERNATRRYHFIRPG